MDRLRRLRCLVEAIGETLTTAAFWRSLLNPPLVVWSGHVWPWPPAWEGPRERGGEAVEVDASRCTRCGAPSGLWRRWWGEPWRSDDGALRGRWRAG